MMTALDYVPQTVVISKRMFDLVVALCGMIMFSVLFPLIALVIKLDSAGPVLFRQLRIGRSMEDKTDLFWMYKFRTMSVDSESLSGAVWASENDPRVTRVGRVLRKTRLDEIPQLFNVLVGDMSIIGPRPERPGFYQKLENEIPYFAERTVGLRPGITGLAQINQGYDRDLNDVRRKLFFDHAYALSLCAIRSWLVSDLRIVIRTVLVMVTGRGQ